MQETTLEHLKDIAKRRVKPALFSKTIFIKQIGVFQAIVSMLWSNLKLAKREG